jgi:5-methylcytosine-specific restriction endonuclease McrA
MSTDPNFIPYEEPPEMDFSDEVSPAARWQRRWRQNNYEKYLLRNRIETARYRAKRLGASGDFTVAEWLMLVAKYGCRCLCCGQMGGGNDLQIDHVVPLEMGGSNNIDNIQPLCEKCNKAKGKKVIDYRKNGRL